MLINKFPELLVNVTYICHISGLWIHSCEKCSLDGVVPMHVGGYIHSFNMCMKYGGV